MSAGSIKSILCPLDFSEFSEHTLATALELGEALGAKVTFLHVVNERLFQDLERMGGRVQLFDGAVDAAVSATQDERAQKLAGMLQDAGAARVDHQSVVTFGIPWEKILETAEAQAAGLIIMGAKGRGSLVRGLRFGSSAEKVFRRAACRTMFVR